jgi:hypothetical protein
MKTFHPTRRKEVPEKVPDTVLPLRGELFDASVPGVLLGAERTTPIKFKKCDLHAD